MFVETGINKVAACGCCWVAFPEISSARELKEFFRLSFDFLVFVQPLVNCCPVTLVLTGSNVSVMVRCVVLKCAQ